MCAIIDANVAGGVFGSIPQDATQARDEFLRWLNERRGKLVIGGKLRQELESNSFKEWADQMSLSGVLISVDDSSVELK